MVNHRQFVLHPGQPHFDPSTGQLVDDNGFVIPESQWKDSWKQTWDADKQYLDDLSKKSFWDYAGIPLMAAGAFTGIGALGGAFGGGAVGPSTAANMAATQSALNGGTLGSLAGTGAGAGGGMNYVTGLAIDKGIGAATNLFGAKMGGNAQDRSVEAQTAAARYAAELQSKTAQEALDFAKQQAALSAAQANAANYGNYTQYLARQQTVGALADMLGIGDARKIAPYVPLPTSTGSGAGASPATSGGPTPSIDNNGDIGKQVSAYFKSRGVSDAETPYWVQKWPELVARGQEIGNPNYAMERLAAADIFGGQPAQQQSSRMKAPLASAPYITTLGTLMPNPMVMTPPLSRGF